MTDVDVEGARAVTGEVEAYGRRAIAIAVDVTDEQQVAKSFDQTIEKFGQLDIVVNSAGGGFRGHGDGAWDKTFDVKRPGGRSVAAMPPSST